MKGYFFTGTLILLVIGAAWSAGCSGSPGTVPDTPAGQTGSEHPRYSPGQLRDLVENASAYAHSVGKDAALIEFSKKEGMFSHGDVYVYAYDDNGILLAHPYQSDEVGQNRNNFTDIRGLPVIRIGEYTASNGGGFFAYLYPAPEGGVIDEAARDSYVPKIGFASPAGEDWWIGSGIYFSDLEGADQVPGPVAEMIDLVEKGVAYGQMNGKDAAFLEISNKSGRFVDAKGHYLYAYDYNGTLLAHPYIPEKIGKDLSGYQGPFGMEVIRALAHTAADGGGYVVFMWPNPDDNNLIEMKIGYVLPVDETWWVGSGVYLNEITGVNTSYPAPLP
ncbi:signal transduction histidine kinase [Methanolinea mesophila]|uniref:cache domain-containing protein n=1 Tax=Methanolinea mesophila TaxID=547055 RepID=UPI001AE2091A|nr:cache domain-containing protein [Methanolinea mesophila]MBP1928445.1 signal transduction histidine kinase [Methanolinea mesophila]